MREHGSHAWLVNTGWSGGGYGVGSRMSLKITRKIIDSILDGSLEKAEFESFKAFGFEIPKAIEGVEDSILNPENTWEDKAAYNDTLNKLATMFQENFEKYTDNAQGEELVKSGPQL